MDVNFFLDGHKTILEFFSESQILVSVSHSWCLSASSSDWLCASPLSVIFYLVVDPLNLSRAVFLEPPIFLSVLVFCSLRLLDIQ